MSTIDDAREWAHVARQKFDHYEQNVEPNWLTNPSAVSHHEQGLVRTVPHLVEQIEKLLTELGRRQAVVDAAEHALTSHRIDTGSWVNTERIQGDALQRLAEAVEALGGGVPTEQQYLIWSEHHKAWWGPNRSGYRNHIADAGRYTLNDANQELGRGCYCCLTPEVVVPAPPAALLSTLSGMAQFADEQVRVATAAAIKAGKVNRYTHAKHDTTVEYDKSSASYWWSCSCGERSNPVLPQHAAESLAEWHVAATR